MDKELIAMYDCPEIQKLLHGQVGRVVRFRTFKGIIIPTGQKRDMSHLAACLPETLAVRTHCTLEQDLTIIEVGLEPYTDRGIIEPRIEDVLEWLENKINTIRIINRKTRQIGLCQGGCIFHKSTGEHDTLKALLKAYMHLSHNKSWNEEAWV